MAQPELQRMLQTINMHVGFVSITSVYMIWMSELFNLNFKPYI